jgi:hypothetical protein
VIELKGDGITVSLGDVSEALSLWEVLPEQVIFSEVPRSQEW